MKDAIWRSLREGRLHSSRTKSVLSTVTDTSSIPRAISPGNSSAQMGTGTRSTKLFSSFRIWRISRLWFEPKLICGDSVETPSLRLQPRSASSSPGAPAQSPESITRRS